MLAAWLTLAAKRAKLSNRARAGAATAGGAGRAHENDRRLKPAAGLIF
jgi:hypothetical protein